MRDQSETARNALFREFPVYRHVLVGSDVESRIFEVFLVLHGGYSITCVGALQSQKYIKNPRLHLRTN